MIVVDASVAVKWFVEEDLHAVALALTHGDATLIAPELVIPETLNALRRKLRRSEITAAQLARSTDVLADTFDLLLSMASLAAPTMVLASELDHSVYDCVYLACAIQQETILVTADERFVRKLALAGYGHRAVPLGTTTARDLAEAQSQIPMEEQVVLLWGVFDQTLLNVRGKAARPLGSSGMMIVSSGDLGPAFDSPSYFRLRRFLGKLSRPELTKILALAWFGRSHIREDWRSVFARAERHIGSGDDQLVEYVISTLNSLKEGIEKLKSSETQTQ